MKIKTLLYSAGSAVPIASDTAEITNDTAKYVIYTTRSCVHLFSRLYDNEITSVNFKRGYDYLVDVSYNSDESVTILDKDSDGDAKVLYEDKKPKDKGRCVIYRNFNSFKLTVYITDGYSRFATYTADTVSFTTGGEHDLHS